MASLEETPLFVLLVVHSLLLGIIIGGGTLVLLVFCVRWRLAGKVRQRQNRSVISSPLKYLTPSGRGESFLRASQVALLPSVAFVMPVKWGSIKAATPKDNWKSQILTAYGGPHESIFVVESADDLAVGIINSLQDELRDRARIKLIVAGCSTTCTQKIHNMLAGVSACDSSMQYVLFCDANGHMHPGTVSTLVDEMQHDSNVLAATGYPLDIPPKGATIWAWTMCQFRYNCLSEFAGNRSDFIWGGALLMRKSDINEDTCGVKSRWLDGGYSDDMLVGACAADNKRAIATPLRALFPNQVKRDVTLAQAWDFLRRQVFVLTTYGSRGNCMKHSLLLFAYAVLGSFPGYAFVASTLTLLCASTALSIETMYTFNFICACIFYISLSLTIWIQKRMLQRSAKLTEGLSPEASLMDVSHLSFLKLLSSFLCQTLLAPFVASMSICKRSIVWGGITYHVRSGKVVQIERPGPVQPIQPMEPSSFSRMSGTHIEMTTSESTEGTLIEMTSSEEPVKGSETY